MASTSWGVRALRHGQARTVVLSRVLARLFLTLRRSWLVDVVVTSGARRAATQLTFNVRGSNARRAVRAYGSAGWTALGLTLVSEIVDSTTHDTLHEFVHKHTIIKGVNPCREHRTNRNTARPARRRVPRHRPARDPRPAPRPTGRDPGAAGPRLSAPGSRPWRAQAATRARTSTKTPPPHT